MATAFAIFCATDGSLTFYNRDTVPTVGDTFEGKVVSNVYTGLENTNYISDSNCPWNNIRDNILKVSFVDTIAPSNIKQWLRGLSNATSIDLENFDTKNLTSLYCAFAGCNSLTELNFSGNYDTNNLTNMSYMFQNCYALTTVNFSGFDTSAVTNMESMFKGCSALKKIYVSEHWSVNSVTSSTEMFYNCTSLVGAVPFDSTKTDASMANYETGYFTYKRYVKPEDMLIKNTTLYNIADEIRILYGTEDTMTPAVMTNQLGNANTEVDEQTDLIKRIKIELGLIKTLMIPMELTKSNNNNGTKTIYFGNGMFVAGDYYNDTGIYYSTDGKTWTQSNITDLCISYVCYGNDVWVACDDITTEGLYYSTDGKTWTQSNITTGTFSHVNYANKMWVAASAENKGIYYSTDGKTWTQSNITTGGGMSGSHYANNLWVICKNSSGLYYSIDGKTWTQSNVTGSTFPSIYSANGAWIAASNASSGTYIGIWYSTDGKNWTQSNITSGQFNSVYYADGIWAACAKNNGIYYSTDGVTWTQSNITGVTASYVYNNNNTWVACVMSNGIYYSIDGKNWIQSNVTNGSYGVVCYENNIWIVASGNGIYYSEGTPMEIELT
ncbi:MAG: BspA family leucine-rich repeat surface protein [Erysipelotrichaceae bacterium]|nr:BspA family leucine-rich repeat surface protein [Erysipelotrichaceae bacterium]